MEVRQAHNNLCENDARKFVLVWTPPPFALHIHDVELTITQRDLRLMLKHVEGDPRKPRNRYLTEKLKNFILQVDKNERKPTNWSSAVPKYPLRN